MNPIKITIDGPHEVDIGPAREVYELTVEDGQAFIRRAGDPGVASDRSVYIGYDRILRVEVAP